MDFLTYVKDEALVLIPVLMILGKIIKISNIIPNRYIPLTLLLISILFTTAQFGITYQSVIQAVLLAGAAVFGHQIVKQARSDQ
ncbi:phage holin family protein [Bacillaceae bacterium W0354]